MTYVPERLSNLGAMPLYTDDVANLMQIRPASLRQLLTRRAFPEPDLDIGRTNAWRAGTVFNYILSSRPELAQRIPRLYPRIANPNPALFLGASSAIISDDRLSEFIVYRWRPSDGGGDVALAYTIGQTPRRNEVEQLRVDLGVSAVIVPSSHLEMLFDGDDVSGAAGQQQKYQPSIDLGYSDESPFEHTVSPSWFDLAYLVQLDLPWWPFAYRDRDVMLRWRPGSAPTPVVPHSAFSDRNPLPLLRLAATVHASNSRAEATVTRFFTWWANHIAVAIDATVNPGEIHYATTPGITVPAVGISPVPGTPPLSALATQDEPAAPTAAETALVLHSQASPLDFAEASHIAASFAVWEPHITEVREIPADTTNPLARLWLDRLQPADANVSTEIGFLYIARYARERRKLLDPLNTQTPQLMIDPANSHCWIAAHSDTVYTTVGKNVATAAGVLETVDLRDLDPEVHPFCPFWSDSKRQAWPLPGSSFNAGYTGTGPLNLVNALLTLAADATADATTQHDTTVRAALFEHFQHPNYPREWIRTAATDGTSILQPKASGPQEPSTNPRRKHMTAREDITARADTLGWTMTEGNGGDYISFTFGPAIIIAKFTQKGGVADALVRYNDDRASQGPLEQIDGRTKDKATVLLHWFDEYRNLDTSR